MTQMLGGDDGWWRKKTIIVQKKIPDHLGRAWGGWAPEIPVSGDEYRVANKPRGL